MAWTGEQYAVTTGAVKLTTALGLAANTYIKQIDIKYSDDAAAASRVYLGPSTLTNAPLHAYAQLKPGSTWWKSEGATQAPLSTDSIYVVGSAAAAGNIIFVDIIF